MNLKSIVVATALLLPASPAWAQQAPAESTPSGAEEDEGYPERIFGWTAVGVGAVAVVAGAVMAGVAAAEYAELDCPGDRCPPELHGDGAAYNDLRVPSGLLIFGGAGVVGVGLAFALAGEAQAERAEQGSLTPVLAPGYLGLSGRF